MASAFTLERNHKAHSIKLIVFVTADLIKSNDPYDILSATYEKDSAKYNLAHTYGMGDSKLIFGHWLSQSRVDRAEMNIITKGGIGNDAFGDPDCPLLTRESILGEVEDSLDDLGTDYVESYMP